MKYVLITLGLIAGFWLGVDFNMYREIHKYDFSPVVEQRNQDNLTIESRMDIPLPLLGIDAGNTKNISITGNTLVSPSCKLFDDGKNHLIFDTKGNKVFCGDKSVYEKYKDYTSESIIKFNSQPVSIAKQDLNKLQEDQKSLAAEVKHNEKLANITADTLKDDRELLQKVESCNADKDVKHIKEVLSIQNQFVTKWHMEAMECQTKLERYQKSDAQKPK